MANKVLALVGPGAGPLVHTRRMGQLLVSFRELTDGLARIVTDNDQVTVEMDCDLEVAESENVRVTYEGKSKKFICVIRSRPNALHTD